MRANPFEPLADDDRIATHFGLPALTLGAHHFHVEDGISYTIGLHSFWLLTIRPSFHFAGLLGSAVLEREGNIGRFWLLRCESAWTVQSLAAAVPTPTPTQLTLPLTDDESRITLDGIGYYMRIKSSQLDSHIAWSNPRTLEWQDFAVQCHELATTLAENAGDLPLRRFVAEWQHYLLRPKKMD